MPYPIRIILVDDHDLIRQSWKTLLENDNRFTVIAQCRNGVEAIEQARNLLPDIILMDINMSPVNGFEATEKISVTSPSVKIIGVSINNNPKYAAKMLALGGRGFVTKTSTFAELITAIQKVHDGEIYICQEIKKRLPAEE
jgi:two-component system invasion response regulator UvrY